MQVSTKAIVLSKLRYSDNDLIVKCYTENYGIKSYLLRNVLKSKKGKFKPAYFQPFTILEINATHKENRSLHYLTDVKLHVNLSALYTDIVKSTIVMFLSEVLSNILKEEEPNKDLFQFLETSMTWFNEKKENTYFHLIFLLELSKYLGFYPDLKNSDLKYFNLLEGKFQMQESGIYSVSGENLNVLKQLLGTKFDVDKKLPMNTNQKQEVLNMILLYFKLHLDGFKEPRSLAVLNQVFR